jgi:hypothetical protein
MGGGGCMEVWRTFRMRAMGWGRLGRKKRGRCEDIKCEHRPIIMHIS